MATLQFSRNTKVYLEQGWYNIWEIPVLDGFSFSQATNASEITLNEMSAVAGNLVVLVKCLQTLMLLLSGLLSYMRPKRSLCR
jgi:hypothetical protein